jgi:hypothetical protein
MKSDKPLNLRERIRNQWDVFELQRHLLESLDQMVRYGLLIFGAVNTGVVILISRPTIMVGLSPDVATVARGVGILYGVTAFLLLADAVRSLRPRLAASDMRAMGIDPSLGLDTTSVLMTLIPVGDAMGRLGSLHEHWQRASGESFSRELSEASRLCAILIERKSARLQRIFLTLGCMLLLAAVFSGVIALTRAG